MTPFNPIVDYDSRGTIAVVRVMLEIGQVLGAFRDRFVIVGGSVPWLLYPDAEPRHIGTLDVDLGLDANALANDDDYVALVDALESSGFRRSPDDTALAMKAFQLRREIVVDEEGEPVTVIVDLLRPQGKLKKRKKKRIQNLRVQEIPGLEIALYEFVEHRLEGYMPDGRPNSVTLRVANIPAFLVMKGYAIDARNKSKDAYDIYYAIRNFPGGPSVLAKECSRLLNNAVALRAYQQIAAKFDGEETYGPASVRLFLEEHQGLAEMTSEQIQVDAHRQVWTWVSALGLSRNEVPAPADEDSPPSREPGELN